jgi:hypothetical protein
MTRYCWTQSRRLSAMLQNQKIAAMKMELGIQVYEECRIAQ